jgi:hypothetical protein
VPVVTTIQGITVSLFGADEEPPAPLDAWRSAALDGSRTFPAIVSARILGDVPALAVWPNDIAPPVLTPESVEESLRRDAVQFVQPSSGECRSCGATVEGLTVLGRFWLGGNRRRHKVRRCPECDADYVHSGLLYLER